MNPEQLKHLKKIIVLTASYYGKDLRDEVISMMAEDLNDLSLEAASSAYTNYRRNPKNRAFPLPAQIRDLVSPVVTPEAEARAIAARIQGAAVHFGNSNVNEARMYMGAIGWSLVQQFGGWNYICTNLGDSIDKTAFEAQMRNKALDAIMYGNQLGYPNKEQIAHEESQVRSLHETKVKYLESLAATEAKEKEEIEANKVHAALSTEEREVVIKNFLAKIKSASGNKP